MVVDGQAVLAQVLEGLSLVDSVDRVVAGPQELFGVAVVVGDQPVDHVLALNLLDVECRQLDRIHAVEVDLALEIGAPFLDGTHTAVEPNGSNLDGVGVDEPADLVGRLLSVGDEGISGAFLGLEQPAVARFVGPELLAVGAADLGLAGVGETVRLALVGPGRVHGFELAAFLGEGGWCVGFGRLGRGLGRFRCLGLCGLFLAAVLCQPRAMFGLDAVKRRLHRGRVGLGKDRDQLVLVGPLPMLELGFLGQVLELGGLERSNLIVEELLLEENFLGLGSEQLLGQTGASGKHRFGILHG